MSEEKKPRHPWGSELSSRGHQIAKLLCDISNVVSPLRQRISDTETLARMMRISEHEAWTLARLAREALGYGPSHAVTYRQIVDHDYPTEVPRTASEWLKASMLDDNGVSFAMPHDDVYLGEIEPPPTPEEEAEARSEVERTNVKRITDDLLAAWGLSR